MTNELDLIITAFKKHLALLFPKVTTAFDVMLNIDAERQQFGDLSSPVALIYARELKTNPMILARAIIQNFEHPLVASIQIAGPGFINFTLTPSFFTAITQKILSHGSSFFKQDKSLPIYRYNIEFVSANPTGPLHIGHGRGGIIGDVLSTILTFLGHTVTKEFYINDAGNQIEKLGASFKIRCQQAVGMAALLPEDGYHGDYLVELAQQAQAQFGDQLAMQPDSFYATYAKNYLLEKIKNTLAAYGIIFDVWFSEKTLHDSAVIPQALEKIKQANYLYEKDGALWFASTAFGDDKDRVVRRADGQLTYVAADIAYLENKLERGAEKLVMVLGQDHHSYVTRLKAVLEALGRDPSALDVILYQLVTIKNEGETVRLSKRAGRIVSLEDIIETVGKDVARFFYLHRKADAHLDFDLALALSRTEENPVYYIQYAYVRTISLLEKAARTGTTFMQINASDAPFLTGKEHLIIKKILALKELLSDIARHHQTHLLAYYIFDLAQLFHNYYGGSIKIIDTENVAASRARLLTVTLVRDTLKLCLQLLGVSTPDKM